MTRLFALLLLMTGAACVLPLNPYGAECAQDDDCAESYGCFSGQCVPAELLPRPDAGPPPPDDGGPPPPDDGGPPPPPPDDGGPPPPPPDDGGPPPPPPVDGGPLDVVVDGELTRLSAPGADAFGRSLSASGDTLVVGADGSIFIIDLVGRRLEHSEIDPATANGSAVLALDPTLVVASDVLGGPSGAGIVRVLEDDGAGNWTELASETSVGANELIGVALAGASTGGEGVILYSAPNDGQGRVTEIRIDRTQGGNLRSHDNVFAPAGVVATDRFGGRLALSDDGLRLAVSATEFDSTPGTASRGRVYLYGRASLSDTWSLETFIERPGNDGNFGDFGRGLAFSANATLYVGCPNIDLGNGVRGAVFTYSRINASTWNETQAISTPDSTNPFFGNAVHLDGSLLYVGSSPAANEFLSPDQGGVFSGSSDGIGGSAVFSGAPALAVGDRYGTTLATQQSGALIVGAPGMAANGQVLLHAP